MVAAHHPPAADNILKLHAITVPARQDRAGWSWSRRDEAMATRILAGGAAGTPTLAVAGSAHTPVSPIELGVPMGSCQRTLTAP